MSKEKVTKEKNQFIFKFQKEDVNAKLTDIFGEKFKKYRDDFNKTQNYLETKFIPDFPLMISVEFVNRCNLNCVMCYKKHHSKPKAELNMAIIKTIMDECKENKMPSITLGLGSEILLYKDILEVIKIVKDAEIQDIFFATNAALLNDEVIESLVDNKISRFRVSLDAATEETYNKVRRVPVLKKSEENINKLIAYKKKANSVLPIIRLSFVVMDINKHETQLFIDKWKDKVDYIDFQRYMDHTHIDDIGQYDEKKREIISDSFCSQPFYSLSVWADGIITPCCTFYGRNIVLGNIYKDKIKDVWQSQKMKEIRDQIVGKKFNNVCQDCLYYRDRDLMAENI